MRLTRFLTLASLFVSSTPALAGSFGGVDVTIDGEPYGNSTHGYAEVWVRVVNRSQEPHTVQLTFPKRSYSMGSDHLRGVTRTVKVEPGGNIRVPIAFPEKLMLNANELGVAVDGSDFDNGVPTTSSRGYRGYGYSTPGALVLYSRSVDTRFPDWVMMRRLNPGLFYGSASNQYSRAEFNVDQWSPNWLGYSRYDGIVVTADDMRTMPAEVRSALASYVECGGSLLVLGPKPVLPSTWKFSRATPISLPSANAGFGQCLTSDYPDLSTWVDASHVQLHESWRQTQSPWQRDRTPAEANRGFPVVEDVSVPVRGLVAVIFVFVILIGPVNLIVLTRKKRKLWLFWTVPVVSFFTCLFVLGYMAITEGWQGRSRIEGFTILDENSRRASSLGWSAYYAPLVPRGGLHFSPDTEVSYQNGAADPYGYTRSSGSTSSALTIDWGGDQHLASGWMAPRVPSHFVVRKSELRRERVTISKGSGGLPEAVNGLGADIVSLWYADEQGKFFSAESIPAGGKATLQPASKPTATGSMKSLRDAYNRDWSNLVSQMKVDGPALLTPRTYCAVLDGAPFFDDGMTVSVKRARSVVYGILKEGE